LKRDFLVLKEIEKMDAYFNIEFIAFDADDTLWENETKFRNAELIFIDILKKYDVDSQHALKELLRTEVKNIPFYGYGTKAFILSLLESSMSATCNKITTTDLYELISMARKMLSTPAVLFDNVELVLYELSKKYRLGLITKGESGEQSKKIKDSNLSKYFGSIEIVQEKNIETYLELLDKFNIEPKKFLMIGNSMKSDILPVLNIGGHAVYIPCENTWEYEKIDAELINSYKNCRTVNSLKDILTLFCRS